MCMVTCITQCIRLYGIIAAQLSKNSLFLSVHRQCFVLFDETQAQVASTIEPLMSLYMFVHVHVFRPSRFIHCLRCCIQSTLCIFFNLFEFFLMLLDVAGCSFNVGAMLEHWSDFGILRNNGL